MTSSANEKPVVAAIITMALVACCVTRVTFAGYVDEVLADNPIAYWRLGEEPGAVYANDLGSLGVVGRYTCFGVTLGEPSLIASDPANTAVRFDGGSGYVELQRHEETGMGGPYDEKSIVLWFKADDVDRTVTSFGMWNEQILYKQGTNWTSLNIYVQDGHVYVGDSNRDGSEWRVHLGTPVSSGEIYQVALVRKWDRSARVGTLTGYLNGQPFAEEVGIAPSPGDRGRTAIGAMREGTITADLIAARDTDLYFQGVIDEVALYNTALSADRILAQYMAGTAGTQALLQAGDANMDYEFDQLDLVQVQIAAKYLTGQTATWGEGDWNGAPGGSPGDPPAGNGLFDQFDIIAAQQADIYLSGTYAAIVRGGTRDDDRTSVLYDANTGEVAVDAPAGAELTSINIDSAGGIFTGVAAQNLGGSFDNDADGNIFKATFGSSFGSLSFGNVAQSGLSEDFVLNDFSIVGSLAGGGDLGDVDLIYVPEPATAVLCGLGMVAVLLLWRRRIGMPHFSKERRVLLVAPLAVSLSLVFDSGVAVADYESEVTADGPAFWWRLDETWCSDVALSVGSEPIDGAQYLHVSQGEPSLIATDTENTAARFDGIFSEVSIPDAQGLNQGGPWQEKSIVLWFQADEPDSPEPQVIYEQGDRSRGLNVYVHEGQVAVGAWNRNARDGDGAASPWPTENKGKEIISLSAPINAGQTYQVGLVMEGDTNGFDGTLMGYLNGQSFGEATGVGNLFAHGGSNGLGYRNAKSAFPGMNPSGRGMYFTGIIDEVALYNTVLPADRIQAQYAAAVGAGAAPIGVPEPSTIVLCSLGLVGVLLVRRRRRM